MPGSENEALIAAIRAEESAKAAHHRLDKMNGSIDQLGKNIIEAKTELSVKIDALLIQAATQFGRTQQEQRWVESRRYVVSTMVALAAALVGTVATLIIHALTGG